MSRDLNVMTTLNQKSCEACRSDAPNINADELARLIKQIPDWQVITEDGVMKIKREYTFENFVDALDFTNKVGGLAEEQNHHPDLLTQWGKTTVIWWSHKIKGLHQNDLIMAAKCDVLLG